MISFDWNFIRILVVGLPVLAVGCGDAPDEDESTSEVQTLAAQGTATKPSPSDAKKVECAFEYTDCLLKAWPKVLGKAGLSPITECTREAEACGLFEDLGDAGMPGVTTSPTCGFEMAECFLKNPTQPSKCSDLKCP